MDGKFALLRERLREGRQWLLVGRDASKHGYGHEYEHMGCMDGIDGNDVFLDLEKKLYNMSFLNNS